MSRSLDQQRAAIIDEIAALGPALPGSLVLRHNRCGRPDCRCHADPPQLHGPYPAWTPKINGKGLGHLVQHVALPVGELR